MFSFCEMFAKEFENRPKILGKYSCYDPGGWGRCVCPVFATDGIETKGCGTGFFVRGIPFGITAEHLLDIGSIEFPSISADGERELDLSSLKYGLSTIIPSRSVIMGTVYIPKVYSQPVQQFVFDVAVKDDPIAEMKGKMRVERLSDILLLKFQSDAPLPPENWLPRVSIKSPEIGEWVCAVGFPDIKLISETNARGFMQNEGMALSFAQITDIKLDGRGYYERSPIAFVESDWPSGMSGGPVFNASGRIVGVVSRELSGNDNKPSCGSFREPL
ncbi:S1 family peptidase [Profundibacter sp.]|uniref:S1 family peptidase n=1 Tax=Profundibacter sp. TaxID=3101071 RepID=UPI003D1392F8